jgi:hypothetical protein
MEILEAADRFAVGLRAGRYGLSRAARGARRGPGEAAPRRAGGAPRQAVGMSVLDIDADVLLVCWPMRLSGASAAP